MTGKQHECGTAHPNPAKLRFYEYIGRPEERITTEIASFVEEAERNGEHPPFTDKTIIDTLGEENTASRPLTVTIAAMVPDEDIAGIAVVVLPRSKNAQAVAELVVHTAHRRRYVAQQLLAFLDGPSSALRKFFPDTEGSMSANIMFWAHGNSTAAQALARDNNFSAIRKVWKMRLSQGQASELPPLPGITVRPFTVGRDEQAWIDVNATTFKTHPEQGAVTLEELIAYEREDWFDPQGFFLAVNPADQILGFVWTKVENAEGEIYVLGISPTAQGRGLGKFLMQYGINYLVSQGIGEITLHVDEENQRAFKLYERNGFIPLKSDVLYKKR